MTDFDEAINRLSLGIMTSRLREAEHLEAKAAAERRVAEMIEVRAIETLCAQARKGRRR